MVIKAREAIVGYLDENNALVKGEPLLEAVMPNKGKEVVMTGRSAITHHPSSTAVFENKILFDFFKLFFGQDAATYDYKWLRAVGNESFTGCHYDVVYMGRGSQNVHTVWIPIGNIPVSQGTLAILEGSHNLESFARLRNTYGRIDVDRDMISEGWFTKDPYEITEKFGGKWLTTEFNPGDVLIFGLYTMHASTTNLTDKFRISCDIRFQPAGEAMDERWAGKKPVGHYAWGKDEAKERPITDLRKEWGI
ncbi:MAG: phytanoyl-CoA dioxygenase family protein [Bacteroidales bacterium]|nr:phytanoyl-CoA dioxygenase family protein [Bacteroidales bacterium]